jgi:hypothetical protein
MFISIIYFNNESFIFGPESTCIFVYHVINSVAFSPQANYTDRATAACRRI